MSVRDLDRFWSKVDQGDGCWLWTASTKNGGYGQFRHEGKTCYAHRLAYEALVGPIPDGLTLDHLCRNPSCVRPDHLDPVPIGVNVLRGDTVAARAAGATHCPAGHAYDRANTYRHPVTGHRACRACHRATERERQRRLRAAG